MTSMDNIETTFFRLTMAIIIIWLWIYKFWKCHRIIEALTKVLSYYTMYSTNWNLFYRRISNDVRKISTVCKLKETVKNTLFTKIKVRLEEKWEYLEEHLWETLWSEQFLANLHVCYIIVDQPRSFIKKLYKNIWKKTVKNRLTIAIIFSTTLHCFRVKIWCIVFSSIRRFECWVTHYHQIMLSLTKYGLSECAQTPRFGFF